MNNAEDGTPPSQINCAKKKCINVGERKIVLSAFVKYLCILHYHKCKVKYIELEMMKVILIRVIKGKNN